jgi:hypothetical protein
MKAIPLRLSLSTETILVRAWRYIATAMTDLGFFHVYGMK